MITTTTRARVDRLATLLGREREALAEFIAELLAFDGLRGWEELGYPSLFEFLVRELRLSRGNAFYRAKRSRSRGSSRRCWRPCGSGGSA